MPIVATDKSRGSGIACSFGIRCNTTCSASALNTKQTNCFNSAYVRRRDARGSFMSATASDLISTAVKQENQRVTAATYVGVPRALSMAAICEPSLSPEENSGWPSNSSAITVTHTCESSSLCACANAERTATSRPHVHLCSFCQILDISDFFTHTHTTHNTPW